MHNPFQDIDKEIWKSFVDKPEKPRNYIGASIVGHPCDRRIWLESKGVVDKRKYIDEEKLGQKLEIFHRGNKEEEIYIQKLADIGYTVKNRQAEFLAFDGKLQGHCDGIIVDREGFEYIFEFKTMKSTSFRRTQREGMQITYPNYITQIQLYAWHFDFNARHGIKQGWIVAQNKDVDWDRYGEMHMINPPLIHGMHAKVERILSYEDDMPGLLCSPDKPSYICKMCDYFKFCYPEK